MNDDRLQRYLSSQSDAIHLEPANADAVMRRGNRRRNQKRGGVLAAVAVLGVLGTSLIIRDNDADQSVESDLASAVVPSNLDWTVVQPQVGLGYGSSSVNLADGTLYALSTAPGPARNNADYNQHLYRSSDGAEWEEAELPTGLKTSTLYGAGDTLYAVGTAPAGGGARKVTVASTTDGGASWANVDLPDDVAQLERQFPGKISISQPSIAAQDNTHEVAVVNVSTVIQPHLYRADIPEESGWEQVPGGLTVYEPSAPCSVEGLDGDPANLTDAEAADLKDAAIAARGGCEAADSDPKVLGTFTWDELGMPAELQPYVNGKVFAYAADDGQHFERVEVPADLRGWGSKVIATSDGYRLFSSESTPTSATTSVLRSADGHTWTSDGTLDGGFSSAGLLGHRPAVALWTFDGHGEVQVQQADGSWTPIDVLSAVDAPAGDDLWLGEVAFGPLGMAATVTSSAKDATSMHSYLVHSADGSTLSVLDLADYFDRIDGGTMGVTVSADAITVRAVHDPDGDPSTVEPTDVLVGTPR